MNMKNLVTSFAEMGFLRIGDSITVVAEAKKRIRRVKEQVTV